MVDFRLAVLLAVTFASAFLFMFFNQPQQNSTDFEKNEKTSAEKFSQTVANRSLMFAYGAYCDSQQLNAWDCKWCKHVRGFEVDTVFENNSLQAFTGWDPSRRQVVVSFRGSYNLRNWITNFNWDLMEYQGVDGARIHQGFYNEWKNTLKPIILPSMQSLMDRYFGSQILVTGHSSGAALAQVASLDIFNYASVTQNSGYRRVEDFGSPRWCNGVLSDHFSATADVHWRVVNVHDFIPTMPSLPGYEHTSREVWYTSDTPLRYQICADVHEDSNCSCPSWISLARHCAAAINKPIAQILDICLADHVNYLNVHFNSINDC